MTFHAISHCSPWTFFFHINTIFICFPFVKPWAHHFPQAAWGVTGKGTYRADKGERTMGGGNSSFISWKGELDHHQEKEPHGLWEGQATWLTRTTVSEKGSWHNSDEAPKHSPTSSPGASHPCYGSSSSRELGCYVKVLWNGTGLEAVARNVRWSRDLGLPSCCGSHWSVSPALHHHCGQWSLNGGRFSQSGRG